MIKAKPLALAQKLKVLVDICEAADTEIENQKLIQKGALDAGKENDGIEPAVVRKILARKKRLSKDPAETTRLEDLMTDYLFMLGEGREDARPWTQADDEVSRVMALTNTGKPPKIEAIKKALGCSQGKAHKLRSIAAVRLAKKSSSSFDDREHEYSTNYGADIERPESDGGPVAVNNQGGCHEDVHREELGNPGRRQHNTDESPAEGEKSAIQDGGDNDAGRLNSEPEVARAAPPGLPADEAPAPPSVGAVAAEPRVAPQSIQPSGATWAAVTAVREAHEAAIEARREARRESRRQENAERQRLSALTDSDMPSIPSFLDRRTAQGRNV